MLSCSIRAHLTAVSVMCHLEHPIHLAADVVSRCSFKLPVVTVHIYVVRPRFKISLGFHEQMVARPSLLLKLTAAAAARKHI